MYTKDDYQEFFAAGSIMLAAALGISVDEAWNITTQMRDIKASTPDAVPCYNNVVVNFTVSSNDGVNAAGVSYYIWPITDTAKSNHPNIVEFGR